MSERSRVKIGAGQWRGRSLPKLAHNQIRPVKSMVKERWFAWAGPRLQGQIVIDFFSGSGALGAEAVSRGAVVSYCLDHDQGVVDAINQWASVLATDQVVAKRWIYPEPLDKILATKPVGLVFWDPPYGLVSLKDGLSWLSAHVNLRPGCLIYVEEAREVDSVLPQGFVCLRSSRSGDVFFALLERR